MASYFVSQANGSDDNSGRFNSPFATLAPINALSLTSGDRVFLERGSVFREQLKPQVTKLDHCNGLVSFRPYGLGPNPIVKGSDPITSSWDALGPNVNCTYQSYVGDICKGDCYLRKMSSQDQVFETSDSYYWDLASGKLTVNCADVSSLENATRVSPILYDNVKGVFHFGIDAGCTDYKGNGSLRAGFGLLVWQSDLVIVRNSKVINAQKHGMGDANSTNVYWKDVEVGGCLGNKYGSASATAFVSFTLETEPSAHYWRDAEATWKAVDGSDNNNTYIAHGSGQDKQRVHRMTGPGAIAFNKQTTQVQDWVATDIQSERLLLVGDNMFVNRATITSPDDARIRFAGDNNRVVNSSVSGPSPFGNIQSFGSNNKYNGLAI